MEKNKHNSIQTEILQKIKTGEAKMRPKWHFVLKGILFLSGIITISLFLLYISSLMLFAMRQSGIWFVPSHSWYAIKLYLFSIPWLLVLLSLVFLIVLEILVRHYKFAYRKPILLSLFIILILVVFGSLFISKIGLHQKYFNAINQKSFGITKDVYCKYGAKTGKGVHPGKVLSIDGSDFVLVNLNRENILVHTNKRTRIPKFETISVGDNLLVMGENKQGEIVAVGIRKIPKDIFVWHKFATSSAKRNPHPCLPRR